MVFVKARKGESNESVIRKFIRKVSDENLLERIRDMQFHHSPSEIKKEKRNKHRRR
ncbi:MAG TPA: 30S ribosomal protein S21 [Patescibacteria group bacterium]|nr:30S ribosomal protein S21 [Patescibacteria group bacterium]